MWQTLKCSVLIFSASNSQRCTKFAPSTYLITKTYSPAGLPSAEYRTRAACPTSSGAPAARCHRSIVPNPGEWPALKASSRVRSGKALLTVSRSSKDRGPQRFRQRQWHDSHHERQPFTSVRYFGVVFPTGIKVANWLEPVDKSVGPLASVLSLVACKQTYDATLHCGLFLQPSAFCTAWFVELQPR